MVQKAKCEIAYIIFRIPVLLFSLIGVLATFCLLWRKWYFIVCWPTLSFETATSEKHEPTAGSRDKTVPRLMSQCTCVRVRVSTRPHKEAPPRGPWTQRPWASLHLPQQQQRLTQLRAACSDAQTSITCEAGSGAGCLRDSRATETRRCQRAAASAAARLSAPEHPTRAAEP